MSETNKGPSRIETEETVLTGGVEKPRKAGIDINKIVSKVRTDIKQSEQEKKLAEILGSYPEWMQWQGPVGLE